MIVGAMNYDISDDTNENKARIEEYMIEAGTEECDFLIFNTPLNLIDNDIIANYNRIKNNEEFLNEIKKYAKEYAIGVFIKYYDNDFNLKYFICNYKGEIIDYDNSYIKICDYLNDDSVCFFNGDINDININRALIVNEKLVIFYNNGIKEITDKNNTIIYAEF